MRKIVRPILRSRSSKFFLTAVVSVVASVTLVQVASAFFTSHGTGTGSAQAALLNVDHLTISPRSPMS